MSILTKARAARVVARSKLDFGAVKDPRAFRGRKQKPLAGVLRLLVAGFACGKMVLRGIEDLSEDMDKDIRRRLGVRGRVSDSAQYELLKRIVPNGFRDALWSRLRQDIDAKAVTNDAFPGGVVSYDGKGAGSGWGDAPNEWCRSSVCDAQGTTFWDVFAMRACLVSSSARPSSARPIVDQELIPSKKGEATTFAGMLERDVRRFPRLFRYVTGDAGLPSKSNAEKVLELNKLYVFQLKGNFPVLFPLAQQLLAGGRVQAQTSERYQGMTVRRELRRVAVPAHVQFPGATQFLGVRQIRTTDNGTVETEDRVYITAIPWKELSPRELLKLIRLHWFIENGANWTTDMILQEDSRRPCNKDYGPIVCSWLLVLAYNIIAVFRARLPSKDRLPLRWERVRELIYQVLLGRSHERRRMPATLA